MEKKFEIPKNVTIREAKEYTSLERRLANLQSLLDRGSVKLERSLDTIDFKLLKDIFINQIRKYVPDFNEEKFISRWRMGTGRAEEGVAIYYKDIEAIMLDVEKVFVKYSQELFDVIILSTVCHEQTHALSYSEHVQKETDKDYFEKVRVGFDTIISNFKKREQENSILAEGNIERYCEYINEAITEKFSKEIFQEYLAYKQPFDAETINEFEKYASYYINVKYFDFLVTIIALKTNLEEEYIKQGFYASMFSGDDFTDSDFRKAINDVLGAGFSDLFFVSRKDDLRTTV